MSAKDLKYYLEHLEEMPTDPAELDRLANEQLAATGVLETEEMTVERIVGEPEESAKAEPEEPKTPTEETPKEESKASEDGKIVPLVLSEKGIADKAKAEAEGKPWVDGILTKDGMKVLPYGMLTRARERAEVAEQLATEQAKELETLRAQKPTERKEPKSEMLTDEDLNAMEADGQGTLAKVLRGQQELIQDLTGTVATLKGSVEHREATEAAEVKSEVQLAIDAVPELAAWQAAEDQTAWNIAASYDKTLRAIPKYKDVPFEDRFKKAVELTKATLAEQSAEKPAEVKPEVKAPTAEEVRAVAEAKLKAKSAQGMPRSLSDIPGGAQPAVDERGRVEQMSAIELGNILLGMTQEQQDAYIAGL